MRRGGHEQPGARERMRSALNREGIDMAELAAGLLYTVGAEESWAKTCHSIEGEREAWCEARAIEDGKELIWNKYREVFKSGDWWFEKYTLLRSRGCWNSSSFRTAVYDF